MANVEGSIYRVENGVAVPYANLGGVGSLADLSDVSISSPTDGQVIKYNNTTNKWENVSGGGGATYNHRVVNCTTEYSGCFATLAAEVYGGVTQIVLMFSVGNDAITIPDGESVTICTVPLSYQYKDEVLPLVGTYLSSRGYVTGENNKATGEILDVSARDFVIKNYTGASIVLPANNLWHIASMYLNRTLAS